MFSTRVVQQPLFAYPLVSLSLTRDDDASVLPPPVASNKTIGKGELLIQKKTSRQTVLAMCPFSNPSAHAKKIRKATNHLNELLHALIIGVIFKRFSVCLIHGQKV